MAEGLSGTRLGAYEVRALLGSGGMAEVYRGYDPALAREVAIKVISATRHERDFAARFQREARLAANLRHPNIVPIYAFGEHDAWMYLVQELLPGPTLAARMRQSRRRLSAEQVQATISQLAAALGFAHGQGVLHRDVKPANALYNQHGQLVLTDFGLARDHSSNEAAATAPGMVMGTPAYLAPEQAISSSGLTAACDIYALGVVLFELLTGRLPFEADTPMGMVLKHLYDEPPAPSRLRPELTLALDKVVLRALRKEPQERYPSATALATALAAAWPGERPAPARAKTRPVQPATAVTPTPGATKAAPRQASPTPKPAPAARAAASSNGKTSAAPKAAPATKSSGTTQRKAQRPSAAQPAASSPTARAATIPAARTALPGWRRRLRVGLLTACVVGALLLFGTHPDALQVAWQQLIHVAAQR